MYVHSVKLINFKSIGDYEHSEIILEPRITAIIGKNESGKSNILDGLSCINFSEKKSSAFLPENINRIGTNQKDNKYVIILKASNEDVKKGIIGDTQVELLKNQCIITGGFLTAYIKTVYTGLINLVSLLDSLGTNPFQMSNQEFQDYKLYKASLQTKDYVDIPLQNYALGFLQRNIRKISVESRDEINKVLETTINKWFALVSVLPVFYYRKSDKQLRTTYKLEDVEKELNDNTGAPKSLLRDFITLIDVPTDDFIAAVRSGITPPQETSRNRIKRLVKSKINKEFQDFYQTEQISLDISFNSGVVSFIVQSADGESLMLSERSNGLRWYLETFIDTKANNISGKNTVYLLDEPGISLHVNAQRELLKLFKHLADKAIRWYIQPILRICLI